jgi:hypothetical protein
MATRPVSEKVILEQSWVWNGDFVAFVRERIQGYSLAVCAGRNPFCDVNLDLEPQDNTDLRGDMRALPFDNHTFDTVVSDPPWRISYHQRMRPFHECVRVCKVGGTIIYNATWVPSSTEAGLEDVFICLDNAFATASIISVHRKTQPHPTYEARIQQGGNPPCWGGVVSFAVVGY